jgi:hypothetical protein
MDLKTAAVVALALMLTRTASPPRAAGPSHVDITWLSITNIYYEIGPLRILTDGYITRLPRSLFSGGGASVKTTQMAFPEDVTATVYAQGVYASRGQNSTRNSTDNVFSDGTTNELATMSGSPSSGYTATLQIGI